MKISDWIFIVFRHIWVQFWAYIRPIHFLGFASLINIFLDIYQNYKCLKYFKLRLPIINPGQWMLDQEEMTSWSTASGIFTTQWWLCNTWPFIIVIIFKCLAFWRSSWSHNNRFIGQTLNTAPSHSRRHAPRVTVLCCHQENLVGARMKLENIISSLCII